MKRKSRWEYHAIYPDPNRTLIDIMGVINALGCEGWEMIQAPQSGHTNIFYFKRPLND